MVYALAVHQIRASHLLFAALGLGAWEPSTPKESLMGSVEWKKTYDAVCQAISGTKTIKNKVVMGWHEAMLAKLAKMAKLAKNRRTNKRKRTN